MKISVQTMALVFFCVVVARAQQEETVRLKSVIGSVEFRNAGSAQWRPARVNMPMKQGNEIRTFVESEAEVAFESGTIIKVGEKSVITVSKAFVDKGKNISTTGVNVATGQMWANVKKLANSKSSFEFETPTATASIRGTRLGISAGDAGTAIDVYEGVVEVAPRGGKAVKVTNKMRATVLRGSSELKLVTFSDLKKAPQVQGMPAAPIDPFVLDSSTTGSTVPVADSGKVVAADSTRTDSNSVVALPGDSAKSITEVTPVKDSALALVPIAPPPKDTVPLVTPTKSVPPEPARARLTLMLISPKDGSEISEPIITVQGTVTPGARVTVNNASVNVDRSGSFTQKIPIPDEAQVYPVRVTAQKGDEDASADVAVRYVPKKTPLSLTVSSPADRSTISQKLLRIAGKTSSGAKVSVNGKQWPVSSSGIFSAEIQFLEKDIGEYAIDVQADDGVEEISKTLTVTVDAKSSEVNTSAPQITVQGHGFAATKQAAFTISAIDRTAGDQIILKTSNNGRTEEFTLENGGRESFSLDEGANAYSFKGVDKAKNESNTIAGQIYYLPGPLSLDIQEPASSSYIVDDLPPLPRGSTRIPISIRVEVQDGIGSVPQTIKYCKVAWAGAELLLRNRNDYSFDGTIEGVRGSTSYTVTAEDLAGNIVSKKLDIVIR